MYFQVDNTPEIVRKKKVVQEAFEVEIPRLVLKPFTAPPVVTFENICINVRAERTLEVFNPTPAPLQLTFVKVPGADLGLELSWSEICIEPDSVVILEISWCPQITTDQRVNIQIADQKKGRYNVIVICKTYVNKKLNQAKAKRKLPLGSKTISLKKSPKIGKPKRYSPKNKMYTINSERSGLSNFLNIDSTLIQDISIRYRNSPAKGTKTSPINLRYPDPWMSHTEDFKGTRRETYLVKESQDYDKENDCSFSLTSPTFRTSRMKTNPKTNSPTPALSAIENLEFTPLKVMRNYKCNESPKSNKENRENFCLNLSPEFTLKRTINHKHHVNDIDSLIDNLEFTPVQNRNLKRTGIEDTEKDMKSLKTTVEILDSPSFKDKSLENINFVTINNHYILKDGTDVKEFSKISHFNNENIENIHALNPTTPTANLTHPIIDLCDQSSKVNGTSESIQYSSNRPNILINGVNEKYYSNTIDVDGAPSGDFSLLTPGNNLSDLSESLQAFNPKRCSTERKECDHSPCRSTSNRVCKDLFVSYSPGEGLNVTYGKLSSDTYIKGDSPIIPIQPNNQSSPYSVCGSPPVIQRNSVVQNRPIPRQLPFSENTKSFNERADLRNAIKEKNSTSGARDIIEANMWQRTSPRSISPSSLAPIPEESTFFSEVSIQDTRRKAHCETFVIDKTFEINRSVNRTTNKSASNDTWRKTCLNSESKSTVNVSRMYKKEESVEKNKNLLHNASEVVFDETYNYVNIKSISTTVNPFTAATCFYDERAYAELEKEFKMWLNYLLTPPADLDTNLDNTKIDIGKAWMESRNKAVPAAPTKEQVSAKYHTSHRLESLRKTAKAFIQSPSMSHVFLKVSNQVEKKFLSIRVDKNIHLDIGLQKIILNLLFCYNPLWLRIGLETLYGAKIPLSSNDDFMGLSGFIIERLFKDPYTNIKHSLPNVHSQLYTENVKKFTLKKFLFLVYFLDQSKQNKIIPHDPCLFCRNAPYKESREILIQFTKEVLSGVGDITKHLKPTGYIVSHKQTYLHEFKYAVHNLAVDLKDGVRLTRLMEIILMKENLTSSLRTPPISLLQKLHNVKIALTALDSAGFQIVGDITAKDIVDGHREKTLSLLWQLINKFRAPLFCNSALVIQKWWRKKYLAVWINNRIENKKRQRLDNAAIVIQRQYRKIKLRRQFCSSAVVIQKWWRRQYLKVFISRRIEIKRKQRHEQYCNSAVVVQRWWRRKYIKVWINKQIEIKKSLRLNNAATKIQKQYRKMVLLRQLKAQNDDRRKFLLLRETAIRLQTIFRTRVAIKRARLMRISVVKIQAAVRGWLTRRVVSKMVVRHKAAIVIQKHWGSYRFRKHQEEHCQMATLRKRWRDGVPITEDCINLKLLRTCAVKIQIAVRGWLTRRAISKMIAKNKAATVIQKQWRSYKFRKHQQEHCQMTTLRKMWREGVPVTEDCVNLKLLRACAVKIQAATRGWLARRAVSKMIVMNNAAIVIQRYWRGYRFRKHQEEYCQMATLRKRWSEGKPITEDCLNFRLHRACALKIQAAIRGWLTRRAVSKMIMMNKAATVVQKHWRSYRFRKHQEEHCRMATLRKRWSEGAPITEDCVNFRLLRECAVKIQAAVRGWLARRAVFTMIVREKAATVIQKHWRSYRFRKHQEEHCRMTTLRKRWSEGAKITEDCVNFRLLRACAVKMQAAVRGWLARRAVFRMRETIKATTVIQRCWRHYSFRKYQEKHCQMVTLRKRWREGALITEDCVNFRLQRACAVKIQSAIRGWLARRQVSEMRRKNKATKVIQRHWRGYRFRKHQEEHCRMNTLRKRWSEGQLITEDCVNFKLLRTCAVKIQATTRGWLARRAVSEMKAKTRAAAVIQRYWCSYSFRKHQEQHCRMTILRKRWSEGTPITEDCVNFKLLRACAVKIQAAVRGWLARRMVSRMIRTNRAVAVIQKQWRRYRFRKHQEEHCRMTVLRRKWLEGKPITEDCINFGLLRMCAVKIQTAVRGWSARRVVSEMRQRNKAATAIQRYWRGYRFRKYQEEHCQMVILRQRWGEGQLITEDCVNFRLLRACTVTMQTAVRGWLARRTVIKMRVTIKATIVIQRHWRTYRFRKHQEEHCQMTTLRKRWSEGTPITEDCLNFRLLRTCTVKIQTVTRGWLARRAVSRMIVTNRAAIVIQKCWRSYRFRKHQEEYCQMTTLRRRWSEGLLITEDCVNFKLLRVCAVKIQAATRGWLARRAVYKMVVMIRTSIVIQRYWRGYRFRKHQVEHCQMATLRKRWSEGLTITEDCVNFRLLRACAVRIQTITRGWLVRRAVIRMIKTNKAATVIQKYWRSYSFRKHQEQYCQMTTLRKMWNEGVPVTEDCVNFKLQRACAVKMQAAVRGWLARRAVSRMMARNKAATVIQKHWRSYRFRKHQEEHCRMATLRNRWSEGATITEDCVNFKLLRGCAVKIQAVVRGWLARRTVFRMREINKAVTVIQRCWRSYSFRKYQEQHCQMATLRKRWREGQPITEDCVNFKLLRACAVKIQAATRGWLARRAVSKMIETNKAATVIQEHWRGYRFRKYQEEHCRMATLRERWSRGVPVTEDCLNFKLMRASAVRIQAVTRGWLARRAVSKMVVQKAIIHHRLATNRAAIVLQKHWRGYSIRKHQAEHCKVAALRKRWREGALQSDQLTLAERSEDAMEVLCHFRDVASVIRAFKTLDYVTNVYPMMYGSKETAVPLITRLVLYMGSTNRSVSTLETLQLGAAILLNLTKYSPTAHYVYKRDHLNIILTLMLRWADKDNLLSRLFCTLLWMFGKYEDIRKEISAALRNEEPYKILCRVRCSLVRKRRMDSKKRLPMSSSTVPKCFNDSMRHSMTPVRGTLGRIPHFYLPSTEPDYGIARTDHPRIFGDEIQAVESIFLKFDLPLNIISDNN